jgi:hypothetical protein
MIDTCILCHVWACVAQTTSAAAAPHNHTSAAFSFCVCSWHVQAAEPPPAPSEFDPLPIPQLKATVLALRADIEKLQAERNQAQVDRVRLPPPLSRGAV